ncbi:hypothetical protein [Microbulbifer epialgicus]|uniref:Uncharacterized protein n=1 Tax=Microbulbifer epialgicus TaxID=393907 RepID=A0ABV4NVL1_9GAMM
MKKIIANHRYLFLLFGLIFGSFAGLLGGDLMPPVPKGYEYIEAYTRNIFLAIGLIGVSLYWVGFYINHGVNPRSGAQ